MTSTINTQDLVKIYRSRTVVNHVSVNVKQGEIVGLLGPNGAGKTTTFYMVVGLIKPEEGKVFLDQAEITRMPMYKRARLGIGYLPQEASVFRKLSVEDNIKSVLEMTRLTRAEQRHKLEALLDEFRLHHVRKNNGDSLSGGERRRTEIARALAVDPKFILLDEPFAGVDPIAVEDIQGVVARLKYKNIGILITDHNVNETLSICDRAYLLIDGKIFQHGTAEELAENEQVRRLYLGRNFELKRKDWLHDEARETLSSSTAMEHLPANSKLELVLDKCINETDKKINMLDNIGIHKFKLRTASDLNLADYLLYLQETKVSIANEIADSELANVNEIRDILDNMRPITLKDYKRPFQIYDWLLSIVVLGYVMSLPAIFYFRSKFRKLQNQLRDTSAALSQIQLLLRAQNN